MTVAVEEQILRSAVEARLRELQPLASEVDRLREVLARLDRTHPAIEPSAGAPALRGAHRNLEGVTNAGDGAASVTMLPLAVRRGSKPGRDGRAPQGANKQRILAAIAEHPGVAAPQIAALTGLKRPVVASTISRLKRTGELESCGEGVRLASVARPQGWPGLAALPSSSHG